MECNFFAEDVTGFVVPVAGLAGKADFSHAQGNPIDFHVPEWVGGDFGWDGGEPGLVGGHWWVPFCAIRVACSVERFYATCYMSSIITS